ncbi:MAG: D-aminoacylase [Gemmataceae bacterium]|nr:D-aminoacylase [Gemmataceae bacterium]
MNCFAVLIVLLGSPDVPVQADFVIRGATVFDGSDNPGRIADVAVQGDRIAAVGAFAVAGTPRVIDGTGLILAPGFIDLHTHCDNTGITTPERRALLNYLTQGVTTVVTGNCGSGPVDTGEYLKKLDEGRVGCNVLHLAPHNSIREKVLGNADRPPTADELSAMKQLVDKAMREGAWGLSSGLEYTPGAYSKTDELIALAGVVAGHGGLYATHMRDEEAGLLGSIEEALTIGQQAGLPVHISHLKAGAKSVWGKSGDAVGLIRQARNRGQRVTADQYPYLGWSTGLAAVALPPHLRRGTEAEYLARLSDPQQEPLYRQAIGDAIAKYDAGTTFLIARYKARPDWQGKTLGTIALREKKSPVDIVLEIERNGGASVVGLTMNEEDVRLIMKEPYVATASDGGAVVPSEQVPHPRSYGTFPRKIGRYSLDDKIVPLARAIHSATGLPADIIGLKDRGAIKPGYMADIVVFDAKSYRDLATFDKPHQYSPGVRYLFVNGVLAIDAGERTTALPGRAIRHGNAR